MPDKTKATLQGRPSHFSNSAENNITRADQVNARIFAHIFPNYGKSIAGGQSLRALVSSSSKLKRGVSTFGSPPIGAGKPLIYSRNAIGDTGITVSPGSYSALHFYPIGGDGRRPQNEVIEEIIDLPIHAQDFGSNPRWCNSLRITRFSQAEMVSSPSCFIACCIASSRDGSTRNAICLFPLGIFMFDICLTLSLVLVVLSNVHHMSDTCKARSPAVLPALTGPLTKPLTGVTTMAKPHSNQTHPKFTWRFLAIGRADMAAKPCLLSVVAETEKDARRVLAPHFILSLAARLPVVEVRHA